MCPPQVSSYLVRLFELGFGLVVFTEGANPDVAEADGVAVFVEFQAAFGSVLGVGRNVSVGGSAMEFLAVVHHRPVVYDGEVTFFGKFTGIVPAGGFEYDVVGLPFAGWFGSIYSGRELAVNGAGLAVRIGFVVVGIEDLHFVAAKDVYAVIAAALAFAFNFGWSGELEVQLEITVFILGADNAGFCGFHVVLFDLPFHFAAISSHPFGKVFAVKKDNGVRRRWGTVAEGFSRGNDGRLGAVAIMDMPFCAGDHRGIGVSQFFLVGCLSGGSNCEHCCDE